MNRRVLDAAPAPVSRAYRLMYDQPDPEQAYGSIALFSEPLIKWYGTIALVLLRSRQPTRLRETGLLSKFLAPSLGTWTQIIRMADGIADTTGTPQIQALLAELRQRSTDELKQGLRGIERHVGAELQKRTLLDFLDGLVAYRNRTRGHGAPSVEHQRDVSQILLNAYEELLSRLDMLNRLPLVYVERSEIVRNGAVHVLRICSGLNSFILPERLTLPVTQALASDAVYLFTEDHQPLLELSPVLVSPRGGDRFYFLNGSRRHVEYLCYDGTGQEYYRPDGYEEAVREFLDLDQVASGNRGTVQQLDSIATVEEVDDLDFGGLGL